MVCYYSSPLIDDLYKDWYVVKYSTASQIKNRAAGDKMPVRNELILMNYEPIIEEQLKIF